ncbi:MAG: hypothetical protein KDD47_20035, partial [Acidobacteria bacterium]|nr:hypothetical protein [Acidobacteriota bacterium]
MKTLFRHAAAALVLLTFLASPASARELYWQSLKVQAFLDRGGLLHIEERQEMVFTGDWNGGERVFRLRSGQGVDLEGLFRIDPATGREVALVGGDLAQVDHYDWTDRTTLRWRSRMPSDPAFDQTTLTYVLRYSLSGALRRIDDKTFRIAPDFIFPDRPGPIRHFHLTYELDPVWSPQDHFISSVEREEIPPGQGAVLANDLLYTGEGWPAKVPKPAPWLPLILFAFGALTAAADFFSRLFRHEAELGRFAPAVSEPIDRQWLEEHLLKFPPEHAGALWDRKVGPPEVAAVLARLVSQGKLESSVVKSGRFLGGEILQLKRKVQVSQLDGYDRQLVAALFFDGSDTTDTDAIRAHYRSQGTGFDPAKEIRPGIEFALKVRLSAYDDQSDAPARPSLRRSALLFLGGLACLALAGIRRSETHLVLGALLLIPIALFYLIGGLSAAAWKRRVDWGWTEALSFVLPAGLSFLAAFGALFIGRRFAPIPPSVIGELGLLLIPLAVAS